MPTTRRDWPCSNRGNSVTRRQPSRRPARAAPRPPGPSTIWGSQLQAGNRQQAVEAFQEAIRRDPKSVDAHYNLSLTYLDMGDKWRARIEFLSVRSLDPDMAR